MGAPIGSSTVVLDSTHLFDSSSGRLVLPKNPPDPPAASAYTSCSMAVVLRCRVLFHCPPQKKWRSILPKKISERRWKQIVHLLKPPNFQKRTMLSFWHCSCQTLFAYVSWTSSSWFMVWPYRHRLPCFAQKKVGIVNVVWKTSLNTCIQYTSYKLEVCGSNEFRYSFFHRTLPNVFAKTCFVIEPK